MTRIQYSGELTNTSGAIRLANQEIFNVSRGDREEAVNMAIVITDGNSNREQNLTQTEVEKLQEEAWVIAVGITNQVKCHTLMGTQG